MANNIDPDQTAPFNTAPDLGLPCLLRQYMSQHLEFYGNFYFLCINPLALRMARALWNFGRSECNGVKTEIMAYLGVWIRVNNIVLF